MPQDFSQVVLKCVSVTMFAMIVCVRCHFLQALFSVHVSYLITFIMQSKYKLKPITRVVCSATLNLRDEWWCVRLLCSWNSCPARSTGWVGLSLFSSGISTVRGTAGGRTKTWSLEVSNPPSLLLTPNLTCVLFGMVARVRFQVDAVAKGSHECTGSLHVAVL